jgi:Flp pilus assembly protein TadB
MFALGAYAVYKDFLVSAYKRMMMMRRLRARKLEMRRDQGIKRKLRQSLQMALGCPVSPASFLALTALIFLIVLLIGAHVLGLITALIISLFSASAPGLILWIRLSLVRKKGSYEGELLMGELLREYRIRDFNIYEALEMVSKSTADLKVTTRLIGRLLYNLRTLGNPSEIKEAAEGFAESMKTNWSKMLAHDIYLAAAEGTNVSFALEDILIQLREARTAVEERKRLNSESMRMVFYMVPLIYILTMFMAVRFLDIHVNTLLINQFGTPTGLIFFFFIVFMALSNMALIQFFTNQTFDY